MKNTSPARSRREFLKQVGVVATLPLLTSHGRTADNTPIRIGFIGVGGQGNSNLGAHIKNTVALCDVDSKHLEKAAARVEKETGRKCATYSDYRKLLDSKDVDAVVVSTPDHWHALTTIHACEAGKHVYCEKPLTLTVVEGRAMVEAARRNKRVVQTGSQQRSDERFRRACELVRNGKLGRINTIRVGLPGVNFKGTPVADGTPPPELDYDAWLGPAPQRPYNEKRVHYLFRFFWDYSGGQQTNFGAHHLDIAQWALGMDESGPVSVEAKARYHKDKWFEVPEWSDITYKYANGVVMLCGQGYKGGVTFEGEKGTLFVDRGKITADPPELLEQELGEKDVRLTVSKSHHGNWLSCIRDGKTPICDVEIGHRSATVCHLGNIAVRTQRKIQWDPAREMIVGDSEAAAMLSRPYRAPWQLPRA